LILFLFNTFINPFYSMSPMDITCMQGEGHPVTVRKTISKHFVRDKLIVVQGGDDKVNRQAVSSKGVDILLDPHCGRRRDFMHQRNSGLNHVLCKLAKQNKVAIGFSFFSILHAKQQGRLMGRMMQNIKLCRKYKVPMVIASFAQNKWELRNPTDLQAFFRVLGMTGKEVQMDYVEKRLQWKRKFISKGVMRE
jgi:RNase P/RNase MRP subunit p30